MKVIFLDVDGVLNTDRTRIVTSWSRSTFVDDVHIERLLDIINATGAVVVLSSDWRYDRDDERYNKDFLELKEKLESKGIHFFGFTKERPDSDRGLEIQEWLETHDDVESFVILDDHYEMEPNSGHLVRTRMSDGLTKERAEIAIKVLNENFTTM